jgi:hypothetical protein
VLVLFPSFLMAVVMGDPANVWMPIAITIATAVVEVAARIAAPRLHRLTTDVRLMLLGLLAPVALWGLFLAVGQAMTPLHWNLHMITGLLTLTGLTGLATAYVALRVRPAPVSAAL